ncbi:MAG: hypothetical protein JXA19_05425 [Anaerolineales bacterium]|nr:hypothetical protein [Anaerolineales bacterium]
MEEILPIPGFFRPEKLDKVYRVPYQERADQARQWADLYHITPSGEDREKIILFLVDIQNTFCLPEFELFVGGKSGRGAVEDNIRLCQFIYRNLHKITDITLTMDTHSAMQIFHGIFLVDSRGNHPPANTMISVEDVTTGKWKFNSKIASGLGITAEDGQRYLEYYVNALQESGKYLLTIWPYHAMLGGVGHALVSAVEEAVFFHSVARFSQTDLEIKGTNPLTEHYSVIAPEVNLDQNGKLLSARNRKFMDLVERSDKVIIAGQAKSHCVANTVEDILQDIMETNPTLTEKIYLLEDCTSPVVIPGVVDFSEQADEAYLRFSGYGMHIVNSEAPMDEWK